MRKPKAKTIPGSYRLPAIGFFAVAGILLIAVVVWPDLDLIVSGWFYTPGKGFVLAEAPVFVFLHWLAFYGARALGAALLAATIIAGVVRGQPICGIGTKAWLFLLLGLLIAPGLVGNVVFKDHWNRQRPREVTEFGGAGQFSPALIPQARKRWNSSFISGDASFGFYLPSFGYVVPPRQRRQFFWGGMLAGGFFAFARLAMGAHFLSDTLFAGLFMLLTTAALHAAMFGRAATRACWRNWLFRDES